MGRVQIERILGVLLPNKSLIGFKIPLGIAEFVFLFAIIYSYVRGIIISLNIDKDVSSICVRFMI